MLTWLPVSVAVGEGVTVPALVWVAVTVGWVPVIVVVGEMPDVGEGVSSAPSGVKVALAARSGVLVAMLVAVGAPELCVATGLGVTVGVRPGVPAG